MPTKCSAYCTAWVRSLAVKMPPIIRIGVHCPSVHSHVHCRRGFLRLSRDHTGERSAEYQTTCRSKTSPPLCSCPSTSSLSQIYFTYLYWVSIIWIIFCIVDIVRHRKKLHTGKASGKKFEPNISSTPTAHTRALLSDAVGKERQPRSPVTSDFNLHIFDDSDDAPSDDETDEHRRRETVSSRRTHDDHEHQKRRPFRKIV